MNLILLPSRFNKNEIKIPLPDGAYPDELVPYEVLKESLIAGQHICEQTKTPRPPIVGDLIENGEIVYVVEFNMQNKLDFLPFFSDSPALNIWRNMWPDMRAFGYNLIAPMITYMHN